MIIKRLQLIKDLIKSKNFNELELEICGLLQEKKLSSDIDFIIDSLRSNEFDDALDMIDAFIQDNRLPSHHSNISVQGLQTHIKFLETQLSVSYYKKAALHRVLTDFRLRHHAELGKFIGEILYLRKEIAYKRLLKTNPDNQKAQKEYTETKNDFEAHQKTEEYTRKHVYKHISEERKKLMSKLFRKASKLCHPDVVSDEMQDEASKIFTELNKAFNSNDFEKVKEIHDLLEQNMIKFAGKYERINESDRLQTIITRLSANLYELHKEIESITASESYRNIVSIENWDMYFDSIKTKLQKDLNELRSEFETL